MTTEVAKVKREILKVSFDNEIIEDTLGNFTIQNLDTSRIAFKEIEGRKWFSFENLYNTQSQYHPYLVSNDPAFDYYEIDFNVYFENTFDYILSLDSTHGFYNYNNKVGVNDFNGNKLSLNSNTIYHYKININNLLGQISLLITSSSDIIYESTIKFPITYCNKITFGTSSYTCYSKYVYINDLTITSINEEITGNLDLDILSSISNPVPKDTPIILSAKVTDKTENNIFTSKFIIQGPSGYDTNNKYPNYLIELNSSNQLISTNSLSIGCYVSGYNYAQFVTINDDSKYTGKLGISLLSTPNSTNLHIGASNSNYAYNCFSLPLNQIDTYTSLIIEYGLKFTKKYNDISRYAVLFTIYTGGSSDIPGNLPPNFVWDITTGEVISSYLSEFTKYSTIIPEFNTWYDIKQVIEVQNNIDGYKLNHYIYINGTLMSSASGVYKPFYMQYEYTTTYDELGNNIIKGTYIYGYIAGITMYKICRTTSNYSYLWSTGEKTKEITVINPGTYKCTAYTNEINTITKSYTIELANLPDTPDKPENLIKPALPPYSKGYYLVCYKGNSILDKLIKIVKKHSSFFQDPNKELNQEIEQLYTHVGILILPEDVDDLPSDVTYLACREDAGVMEYTEPRKDIDVYKINLKTVDTEVVEYFFNRTQYLHGSMITDMGYRHLAHPGTLGSVDWVAMALNLAFPKKYTITRLIEFSQLEE